MNRFFSRILSLCLIVSFAVPTYAMEPRSDAHLKGIDVSHWNGSIDWSQVEKSGVSFAYLKATEGTTITDGEFANYAREARKTSIAVGAYHYARPASPYDPDEAVREAVFFVNAMRSGLTDFGDIMPVLDLEENGGLSSSELAQWARTFIHTVELATNRQVMLYTSEDFLLENGMLESSFSDLPLWVSYWEKYYGDKTPPDIAGWKEWTIWQYSDRATVPGIQGDVDVNAGPLALNDLLGELPKTITLQIGSRQATVNGVSQPLDASPFIAASRTMVPIRFISETLGAKVDWNPVSRQVTISKGESTLVLAIGQKQATVDGAATGLDAAAQIQNGRTFVPLRFISESLDRQVDYQPATKTIKIY